MTWCGAGRRRWAATSRSASAAGGGASPTTPAVIVTAPRPRAGVPGRPGCCLPVRVLGRLFRGKFLALLAGAFRQGRLAFRGRLEHLADATAFGHLIDEVRQRDWVVYAKPPFGGPAQVLKYLARYRHRVAISNGRLLDVRDGRVTFRYKDYADAGRDKLLALPAADFLRRFRQHVLPKGFVKVR